MHTSLYHPARLPLCPAHFSFGVATNYIVSPKRRSSVIGPFTLCCFSMDPTREIQCAKHFGISIFSICYCINIEYFVQTLLYSTLNSSINILIVWLKTDFNACWKNVAHESPRCCTMEHTRRVQWRKQHFIKLIFLRCYYLNIIHFPIIKQTLLYFTSDTRLFKKFWKRKWKYVFFWRNHFYCSV